MIYVDNQHLKEAAFVALLSKTKASLTQAYAKALPTRMNGTLFERHVFEKMNTLAVSTPFEGHLVHTGPHAFPDIVARKLYGVEVKMTTSDRWTSTGNSVLESTRVKDVATIYMLFGKFGGRFDIKYRKYQDCLYDIGVTHSPRYKIDMALEEGHTIFHKLGIDYEAFRHEEEPIKKLQAYYRKQLTQGQELWWLGGENTVSPIIQPFSMLERSIKDNFINECMTFFPAIFGRSTMKFERAAAYLVAHYNAVAPSLRDSFTAGGKKTITINGKHTKVPRLIHNLFTRAKKIHALLASLPSEQLSNYWHCPIKTSPLATWKHLLAKHNTQAVDIVAVFSQGLK